MAEIPKPDYSELVKQSGIPTDSASWKKVLKDVMAKEECIISNDSLFSPFWRLIESAVVQVTLWLINTLLVGYVLPNMFLATAVDQWLDLRGWQCKVGRKGATEGKGFIALVKSENKIIAASFILKSENRLIYRTGTSNQKGKDLKAMFFLVESIIKTYSSSNYILDFEGSELEGVARFYNGFGGINVPYFYYKKVNNKLLKVLGK